MTDASKNNSTGEPEPFSLESAVDEFYETFPSLQTRIFFINCETGALYHPHKNIGNWAIQHFNKDRGACASFAYYHQIQSSTFVYSKLGTKYVLHHPNPLDQLFGPNKEKVPIAQRLYFAFDHEVGHALVSYNEYGAEAYALLRHIQRYGHHTQLFKETALSRSFDAVSHPDSYGHIEHCTVLTFNAVREEAKRTDIAALSPVETVECAKKLLPEVPWETIGERREAFEKAFSAYNSKGPAKIRIRALAKAVFETDNYTIQACGVPTLEALLDGDLFFRYKNGKPLLLQGKEWDRMRAQLKSLKPIN